MISYLIDNFDDVFENLNNLLILEKLIEFKKLNNIDLTREELFFDIYMVKPSFMLKILERSINEK